MTGFLVYPEIDGESNFPPVIRQALARSQLLWYLTASR